MPKTDSRIRELLEYWDYARHTRARRVRRARWSRLGEPCWQWINRDGATKGPPGRVRARLRRPDDGDRRHLAAGVQDRGHLRHRSQTQRRQSDQRPAVEGILSAAVVDRSGLPTLRTRLGERRQPRRRFQKGKRGKEPEI